MDDALHPLRCAYGAEAPGDPPPAPPGAGETGHAEWAVLAQMRDVLNGWPAPAPDAATTETIQAQASAATEAARLDALAAALPAAPALRPAAAVLHAVDAFAAQATLAAVRHAYGEADATSVVAVRASEAALLAQSRRLLDDAPRAAGPSREALAAVLARAEEASLAQGMTDAAVTAPHLAPIAAVYGLGGATADPVETAVLMGARDALTVLPRLRPEAATLAAVVARAAVPPVPATPRSASANPAPRAADRAPVAGAAASPRRFGRTGAWAGSAALVGALLLAVVLFPREAAAPDAPIATTDEPPAAATSAAETPEAERAAPLVADATPAAPEPRATAAPTTAPGGLSALAAAAAPSLAQMAAAAPSARPPARPPVPTRPAPAPSRETRTTPSVATAAAAAFAPVAARTAARTAAPSAPDGGWDASGDLHTISLRMRALRQATPGSEWDAPAEAFGAPRAPVTMSAMPGLQSVRAGAAPARARVRPDSAQTGN